MLYLVKIQDPGLKPGLGGPDPSLIQTNARFIFQYRHYIQGTYPPLSPRYEVVMQKKSLISLAYQISWQISKTLHRTVS